MNRKWTTKELDYLEEHWGTTPKEKIAKELNRTEIGVRQKARKLNMGKEFQDYLTFKEVGKLVGMSNYTISNAWVRKGLKCKKYGGTRYVSMFGLLKFLKDNQNLWNSEHLEEFILGSEPEWLKEKRKVDAEAKVKNRNKRWTKEEDEKLVRLSKTHRQPQIAKIMNRSLVSITVRVSNLRKEKVIKPSRYVLWKPVEDKMLMEMDKQGKTDKEIAQELGRETTNVGNRRSLLKKNKQYPCHHKKEMRLMQKEVANG